MPQSERMLLAFSDLQELYYTHPEYTPLQYLDALATVLCDKYISIENRHLLEIAFNQHLTQNSLDDFLKDWDIEKMTAEKALLLAYVMKKRPDLDFGFYNGPRLKGLLNYYRFQNLELISYFAKIVTALNSKGVYPMILKGGAMKYIRPELPRVMGDIDILVSSDKDYTLAKKTVLEMNYIFAEEPHSIDVHLRDNPDKGILDIHQHFGFYTAETPVFIKHLFKRAQLCNVFSAQAYQPSHEDLFFICLNNITRNLRIGTSLQTLLFSIFDLAYLVTAKEDFNWNIVFRNIFKIDSCVQTYIAIKFIDVLLPNLLSERFLENKKFISKVCRFIYKDKFYALYVHNVKHACKHIKFKAALKDSDAFKHYISLKTQHFFTKRIVKSPFLSKLCLNFFLKGF